MFQLKNTAIQCTNLSTVPSRERSHIPSWEKENHRLKSAYQVGDILVPRRVSSTDFFGMPVLADQSAAKVSSFRPSRPSSSVRAVKKNVKGLEGSYRLLSRHVQNGIYKMFPTNIGIKTCSFASSSTYFTILNVKSGILRVSPLLA